MKKPEPLIIIKDTRESNQYIYLFKSAEFKDKVLLVRHKLDCGDFSICGNNTDIMIERKQLNEIVGNFCHDRERWENEWKRAVKVGYRYKYLMVEGNFHDLISGEYRSAAHPNSIIASIMSWSLRYGFSFFFVPDSSVGQNCVYWLLREYQRLYGIDNNK